MKTMDIGANLKHLRGERTLREVGKATGYDFTWLSKVEHNREVPSWSALKKLLKFYKETNLPLWAYCLLVRTKEEQFSLALKFIKDPQH